ncbi:MAG TPA: biotin--[acetyl-CoA-carboxylase] ligase, partial [Clostridia bacterium]|nr:biotin--[acetyl-CoA-carboxylase] ligase [Clostridia bacterium]
ELNITRAAVWKQVNELKAAGFLIESVPQKGYRLIGVPDILEPDAIKFYSPNLLVFYEQSSVSTNLTAKAAAISGAEHGSVFVAEEQTDGRGRMGRRWISQKNAGIYMSIVLKNIHETSRAPLATLAAALAVSDVLSEISGIDVRIKWPNDILINNKKVCGILTEMGSCIDGVEWIVVGAGINVRHSADDLGGLVDYATSLYIESGKHFSRPMIAAKLAERIMMRSEEVNADSTKLIEEYKKRCDTLGKNVTVIDDNQKYQAVALDIQPDGALTVLKGSEKITVYAGEVSIRRD